ncbi:hypothetical protein N0B31_09645 [Salinirubellus salinus]|uniref:Uncharacterized protein n=1 Tax=Salinirubellus salinus TaxID=1364945 RepID=A0A9E7UCR1_9EURY|nr:hypothetical protein [Salinirubellus salinus]UWM56537.1 hypothetical protein N0B31_09645 [Salinirubellus salinus]
MLRDPQTRRTAERYRPRRAPPLAVTAAVAAVPPLAVVVATYPVVAAALALTATVLVAARRRPERA